MDERINIEQWLKNFENGDYEEGDFNTQVKAGWYDWFCKDTSLKNKTVKLGKILKKIVENGTDKFDPKNTYVFFKNNCPMSGPLYDDFRICSLETGEVLLNVTPKSGHSGKAEVYDARNGFDNPSASGTLKDIYNYFLEKRE